METQETAQAQKPKNDFMEYLEVKNFGPIKHAKVEIKKVNVFIGETSSGKSTLAKLITIFKDARFSVDFGQEHFIERLQDYGIEDFMIPSSYIFYQNASFQWILDHEKITGKTFSYSQVDFSPTPFQLIEDFKRENGAPFMDWNGLSAEKLAFIYLDYVAEGKPENKVTFPLEGTKEHRQKALIKLSGSENDPFSFTSGVILGKHLFFRLLDSYGFLDANYIPAERTTILAVAESIFSIQENRLSLPRSVILFGSSFQRYRKEIKNLNIDFLNTSYSYEDHSDYVTLDQEGTHPLSKAASGLQSTVPMMVVLEGIFHNNSTRKHLVTIEEPELNLYPTMQKQLVEYLVGKLNATESSAILTTHSPYILTAIDNLIQAQNAYDAHPEARDEIAKLVAQDQWLKYKDVACYYFENGTCRSTMDDELKNIGASNIDSVSDDIGHVYESLIEIELKP